MTDVSEVVADAFRSSALALCSVTYNGELYPAMHALLNDLKALGLRGRTVGLMENGSWASAAGRKMSEILQTMKDMTIVEPMVTLRSDLRKDQMPEMEALAKALAESCK